MPIQEELFTDTATFFLVDENIGMSESLHAIQEGPSTGYKQLNGEHAATVAEFMEEAFVKFKFPAHFGRNWSAFSDSFTDRIADYDGDRYILLFTHADHVLSKEPAQQLVNMFDTLNFIIDELSEEGELVLKIVFLVKDAKHSHLGDYLVNSKHEARVISGH